MSSLPAEEERKIFLSYDSLHNPFRENDLANPNDPVIRKPWLYMTFPFKGVCCVKIYDITVKYKEGLIPSLFAGYLTITTSKRLQSRLNEKGDVEVFKEYKATRNLQTIHIPLSFPGTEKPKALHGATLSLKDTDDEIKMCISDEDFNEVELDRMFISLEIIPRSMGYRSRHVGGK